MDTSRRNFLRGAAALAACAVLPGSLQALPLTDRERLAVAIRTGRVVGQDFAFEDRAGVTIWAERDLVIRHCRFIWLNGLQEGAYALEVDGSARIEITHCHFDPRGPRQLASRDYAVTVPAYQS